MKPRRYQETLPVRLSTKTHSALKKISGTTGLSLSDTLRLAVNHGLPKLERGLLPVTAKKDAAA